MDTMTTPSSLVSFIQSRVFDYWELTKPRLVLLVLLSTVVGYFLAVDDSWDVGLLLAVLIGTAFVAASSMALNQWMEKQPDARMSRTAKRPLPAGRLDSVKALVFGIVLGITGLLILFFTTNVLTCFLSALTVISYLFLYTPLKQKTELCTIVGAIPGALPPLIGWAAVRDSISFEAWILFFIVFFWQMPHFLAIGWMYRKEYEQAGFCMLSCTDQDGQRVARQIVLYSCALLPVSLLPSVVGLTGIFYFFGAFILGIVFVVLAVLSLKNLDQKAKMLFRASIAYLTFLFIFMLLDKQ